MVKSILVIGSGFLGNAICNESSKSKIKTVGTHFKNKGTFVDITKIDSIEKLVQREEPDVIYNCAALTNIDEIEIDPKHAYSVNAYGAKNIATISSKYGCKLIHISTDSVFDGKKGFYSEEDQTNPINEYAKSKKLGEDFVKDFAKNFVIVRTNFYGRNNAEKFLFNWILNNLKNKKSFTAFDDVLFNPLEINNLAEMLIKLSEVSFNGVIHISSDQIISKYDFAQLIAEKLNLDKNLIKKGSINEANLHALRPLNTSLNNSKTKSLLTTRIISLEEWLLQVKIDYS